MTTMMQDKDGKIAAAPSTKPSDRHFRNAWVFSEDASAITEDITEAKKIFQDKIRNKYFEIIDKFNERCVNVNGNLSVDEISTTIWKETKNRTSFEEI